MKKMLFAAFTSFALLSCNNDKAEEKKVMDDILATHEKVMDAEDKAMANKVQLDSMVKINKLLPEGLSRPQTDFKALSDSLNTANEAMENWMHSFDPDYKGKSHAEVMNYLNGQRVKIKKINSRINRAIAASTRVLAGYKK